ncbi:MAG: hypothetical protein M1834_002764 [Cirrosporium novae-zelandiae]|nr:MAG: hypothetical protein M1834_002764 [Cirrosporium novae-zelandiae]
MPYTPPSQQSPIATHLKTSDVGRLASQTRPKLEGSPIQNGGRRPSLPRSASSTTYLHKHRRSPSISKPNTTFADSNTNEVKCLGQYGSSPTASRRQSKTDVNGSLRQSPPPVSDSFIPPGALVSPPDSTHSSSDDEENSRSRARELSSFAELEAAIKIMQHPRGGSPHRHWDDVQSGGPVGGKTQTASSDVALRPPLSKEARRISHSRSATQDAISYSVDSKPSGSSSDSDDEDFSEKPPMVRKKSGELVRPSLRPPSRRRPSSMPGTPTFSKSVHFDSHLEHVRHFLQVDKPTAVSAGSSPVDMYENELEFPFGGNDQFRTPPFEWELRLANFSSDAVDRKAEPVTVERIFLSSDNKNLVGTVSVQNIAFNKSVTVRFTLDYWKTTSEVMAEYTQDVRRKQAHDGRDRFSFTIKLADQANLETKTLFFCVRYNVNGIELWDNNRSLNYQVDFTKKPKPFQGKQGVGSRTLHSLPRSRPQPSTVTRPRSMPVSFDDFAHGFDTNFGPFDPAPPRSFEDAPIRLKKPQSKDELVAGAPVKRNNATGQAFGNRYDFSASLSAAMQNMGERGTGSPPQEMERDVGAYSAKNLIARRPSPNPMFNMNKVGSSGFTTATDTYTATHHPKPSALMSEKPSMQSSSYHELLNKYCFFGSHKSTPQLEKAPSPSEEDKIVQTDGPMEDALVSKFRPERNAKAGPTSPHMEDSFLFRSSSPTLVRSTSPVPKAGSDFGDFASRSGSPVSLAFPYQTMQPGLFDSPAPTAIRG